MQSFEDRLKLLAWRAEHEVPLFWATDSVFEARRWAREKKRFKRKKKLTYRCWLKPKAGSGYWRTAPSVAESDEQTYTYDPDLLNN